MSKKKTRKARKVQETRAIEWVKCPGCGEVNDLDRKCLSSCVKCGKVL